MKLRSVLLVALLVLPVSSFADFSDCPKFAGSYVATTDNSRSPYLEISWDASHLIISYLETRDGSYNPENFTVAYVADGTEQTGDVIDTGKTYTASCDSSGITIVRVGLFVTPYTTQFTLSAGVLTEVNSASDMSPQTIQYQAIAQ